MLKKQASPTAELWVSYLIWNILCDSALWRVPSHLVSKAVTLNPTPTCAAHHTSLNDRFVSERRRQTRSSTHSSNETNQNKKVGGSFDIGKNLIADRGKRWRGWAAQVVRNILHKLCREVHARS